MCIQWAGRGAAFAAIGSALFFAGCALPEFSTDSDPCFELVVPDEAPTVCSSEQVTAPASTTFVNKCTNTTLYGYWINFSCEEEHLMTLDPGDELIADGFAGDLWRLRDPATGRILKQTGLLPAGALVFTVP